MEDGKANFKRQREEITVYMIGIHMYFTQLLLKANHILYLNFKLSILDSNCVLTHMWVHIHTHNLFHPLTAFVLGFSSRIM